MVRVDAKALMRPHPNQLEQAIERVIKVKTDLPAGTAYGHTLIGVLACVAAHLGLELASVKETSASWTFARNLTNTMVAHFAPERRGTIIGDDVGRHRQAAAAIATEIHGKSVELGAAPSLKNELAALATRARSQATR